MPENLPSTPLVAIEAVVLDTETTGLDARTARIVQIGILRMAGKERDDHRSLECLVNPGVTIPPASTAIHGIRDSHVAASPPFAELAQAIDDFIGGSIVIGHSIAYDLFVLRRENQLAGRSWAIPRALDVRVLARIAAPSLVDHSLDRLCEWLTVPLTGRHSAMGDAQATARVFSALVPHLRAKGVRTLAEAELACRALAEREAHAISGTLLMDVMAPIERDRGMLARVDSFPYRHRVSEVMSSPPVTASRDMTVRQAMQIVIEQGTSSVFVQGSNGETGIVTERDLLRALHSVGADGFGLSLGEIMKAPLQTVAEDAFVYRAIGRMERLGFRHLGVRDSAGTLIGAVTPRNLLRHRATTAIVLGDEIEVAPDAAALARAWSQLPLMARSLREEDVDPGMIAVVISTEISSMTRRAAELAEQRMAKEGYGAPPVGYAILVLGSAGRGESQLAADQDNGIVHSAPADDAAADRYLELLAGHIADTLDEAGIPYCKGGVMARNRMWRRNAAEWRSTIDGWVKRQRPEDILNVDIFFDSMVVHGDSALGEEVWRYAYQVAAQAHDFQNLLIESTRRRGSPFTMLGRLKLDEQGRIDLKRYGLMPIFSAARVLSIKHRIEARSTADRLQGLTRNGRASDDIVAQVLAAHRLLLGFIIDQQLTDGAAGIPLSTRVDPRRLDNHSRSALKKAFAAVDEAVGLVAEGRI